MGLLLHKLCFETVRGTLSKTILSWGAENFAGPPVGVFLPPPPPPLLPASTFTHAAPTI